MSKKSHAKKTRKRSKSKNSVNSEFKNRELYHSMIIKSRVNQVWRWDNLEDATEEVFGKKSNSKEINV